MRRGLRGRVSGRGQGGREAERDPGRGRNWGGEGRGRTWGGAGPGAAGVLSAVSRDAICDQLEGRTWFRSFWRAEAVSVVFTWPRIEAPKPESLNAVLLGKVCREHTLLQALC